MSENITPEGQSGDHTKNNNTNGAIEENTSEFFSSENITSAASFESPSEDIAQNNNRDILMEFGGQTADADSDSDFEVIEGNESELLILQRFPDALPGLPDLKSSAFGVRKTNLDFQVTINEEHGTWSYDASFQNITDPAILGLVEGLNLINDLPISGQISRCHDLTLDNESKRAANIPENATRFCWGNPMCLSDTQKEFIAILDPNISTSKEVGFFLYGGFMYLSENELVQCNSLVPANDGLFFGHPLKFYTAQHRNVAQKELELAGRFQEITIGPFREQGARYFCWLLPGEYGLCEHGGFLYLFGDSMHEHHEKDRYFSVLGGSDLQERLEAVSNLIQRGRLEDTGNQGQGQEFGHAQMSREQLERLKRIVKDQRDLLNELLNRRQQQENIRSEEMKSWTPEICCQKFAEVGVDQRILDNIRQSTAEGSDFIALWRGLSQESSSVDEMALLMTQLQIELESNKQCCICFSNARQMLFKPCNHIPSCKNCAGGLDRCPICRAVKQSSEEIHL